MPDASLLFIGSALSGAQCGCVCPTCGSPLVAKQGDINAWHFAHEAGQERPECEAGAANMLIRIMLEIILEQGGLQLPQSIQTVFEHAGGVHRDRAITRDAMRAEVVTKEAVMPEGCKAQLATQLGIFGLWIRSDGVDASSSHAPGTVGTVALFFDAKQGRPHIESLDDAVRFLNQSVRCTWRLHVDVDGREKGARDRLRLDIQKDLKERERAEKERIRLRTAKWRTIQSNLQNAYKLAAANVRPSKAAIDNGETDDAPAIKTSQGSPTVQYVSYIFYRMRDGSAWVMTNTSGGGCPASSLLSPALADDLGWDEAMPARIGTADLDRGGYAIVDLGAALIYLNSQSLLMRTSSNLKDFEGL